MWSSCLGLPHPLPPQRQPSLGSGNLGKDTREKSPPLLPDRIICPPGQISPTYLPSQTVAHRHSDPSRRNLEMIEARSCPGTNWPPPTTLQTMPWIFRICFPKSLPHSCQEFSHQPRVPSWNFRIAPASAQFLSPQSVTPRFREFCCRMSHLRQPHYASRWNDPLLLPHPRVR